MTSYRSSSTSPIRVTTSSKEMILGLIIKEAIRLPRKMTAS